MADVSLASASTDSPAGLLVAAALPDLLAAQDGLITRAQALAAGMTDPALRHAERPGGPWQRLDRSLYATFTGDLGLRHRLRAALLLAGPDAVLTGEHAFRAHGLRYVPDAALDGSAPPQVLVPLTRQLRANRWVRPVRTSRLPAARWRAGLPIVPVERAVDTALVSPSLQDVRALVCEPVQRRLTTAERMAAEAALAPVRRHARIAAAGWAVLPIGPRRIRREPVPPLLEIEAAYRAGLLSRQPW